MPKARDTNTGRMTVGIGIEAADGPIFEMICTMTRPTISSIMAALLSTTPSRLDDKPLERRMANVVPKLVEHNAAPAAKHCR